MIVVHNHNAAMSTIEDNDATLYSPVVTKKVASILLASPRPSPRAKKKTSLSDDDDQVLRASPRLTRQKLIHHKTSNLLLMTRKEKTPIQKKKPWIESLPLPIDSDTNYVQPTAGWEIFFDVLIPKLQEKPTKIRFAKKMEQIAPTIALDDYSKQELASTFYTDEEWKEMDNEQSRAMRKVQNLAPEEDMKKLEKKEVSYRGFENQTDTGDAIKCKQRKQCRYRVLAEQDKQWDKMSFDWDKFAVASRKASKTGVEIALKLAKKDEEFVRKQRCESIAETLKKKTPSARSLRRTKKPQSQHELGKPFLSSTSSKCLKVTVEEEKDDDTREYPVDEKPKNKVLNQMITNLHNKKKKKKKENEKEPRVSLANISPDMEMTKVAMKKFMKITGQDTKDDDPHGRTSEGGKGPLRKPKSKATSMSTRKVGSSVKKKPQARPSVRSTSPYNPKILPPSNNGNITESLASPRKGRIGKRGSVVPRPPPESAPININGRLGKLHSQQVGRQSKSPGQSSNPQNKSDPPGMSIGRRISMENESSGAKSQRRRNVENKSNGAKPQRQRGTEQQWNHAKNNVKPHSEIKRQSSKKAVGSKGVSERIKRRSSTDNQLNQEISQPKRQGGVLRSYVPGQPWKSPFEI